MSGRVRIVMTNPTCWPEIRRGSERLLHEHAAWQAAQGHDVTVIATHQGPRSERQTGLVRHILLPRRLQLGRASRWLGPFHAFALQLRDEIRRARAQGAPFNAAHCLNYHDAFGVLLAGAGRPRLAYHAVGIPMRAYFRWTPHDGWMFRHVLRHADACAVTSRHAQQVLLREFGTAATLLPSPCDLDRLAATRRPPADGQLRLLFAADADEPRKGAVLLARAFALVRDARPDARLVFGGPASAATMQAIRAAARPADLPHIEFAGPGTPDELPARYAAASVLVHPAVWEAQGMVAVEALACGTPVVACDHGGVADIVGHPGVGRLFQPGPIIRHVATGHDALARAILEAAELARDPATEARCRAHAVPFGWPTLGPAYARLLGLDGPEFLAAARPPAPRDSMARDGVR